MSETFFAKFFFGKLILKTPFFNRVRTSIKLYPLNDFFQTTSLFFFKEKEFRNMRAFELFKLLTKLSFKSNVDFRNEKLHHPPPPYKRTGQKLDRFSRWTRRARAIFSYFMKFYTFFCKTGRATKNLARPFIRVY